MKRLSALVLLAAIAATPQASDNPQTATFKAGTRLVEVEVVVRNNNGPVTGLTKDDFTLLDQGNPQRIDVFREGRTISPASGSPLPPGAVSNRVTSAGRSVSSVAGYTVVLYDQLNTRIDLKEYERKALVKFIRGMGPQERVAIYVLGRDLHVLQEFTDDPAKLIAALQRLDSGRDLAPKTQHDALLYGFVTDEVGNIIIPSAVTATNPEEARDMKQSVNESAANVAQVNTARNSETAFEALQVIARHLGGMPGRRNLVWMRENPLMPPPPIGIFQQFNIALYLVLAHSLEFDPSGMFMGYWQNVARALTPGEFAPLATLMPDVMETQREARQLSEMTGGAGFGDAEDLALAVKTAEEDSRTSYTLGYYPSEEALDGKYHSLTVKAQGKTSTHPEVRYRPGYLATKQPAPVLPPENELAELFRNPLDDTGLGIKAQFDPDSKPGHYKVLLNLDLHELNLIHENGHSRGSVELAFRTGQKADVHKIAIDVTDAQLADALRDGYNLRASGVPAVRGSIRVVVRDPATGVAGSLTIPVQPTPAAQSR